MQPVTQVSQSTESDQLQAAATLAAVVLTSARVKIDNQFCPIPVELAQDDEKIRRALAPFYPGADNARLERQTVDGVMTIDVIKMAGPKGLTPLAALDAAPEQRNPVVLVYQKCMNLTVGELADQVQQQEMVSALETGEALQAAVLTAKHRLNRSAPLPAPVTVLGF